MNSILRLTMVCVAMLLSICTAKQVSADSVLTPITIVIAENATASGAINATGTYDMPVTAHGRSLAIQCMVTIDFPNGSLLIRMNCEFAKNHGQWQIISGTSAYQGMRGNGTLVMDENGETLTGYVRN